MSVTEIKYGKKVLDRSGKPSWHWSSIQKPIFKCSEKVNILFAKSSLMQMMLRSSCVHLFVFIILLQVTSGLSSLQFKILNVPVSNVSECLTEGTFNT